MGESNDERIARKKRERAEFLKQEAADAAMAEKLDKDPEFAKTFDSVFTTGFRGLEDDIIDKAAKELGFNDKQIQKALEEAQRARKVAKGGFFVNADPEKAAKIVEENLVLNRVVKAKSEKSCFIAALVLLASGSISVGGILWAAGEVLTRVFS